MAKLDLNRFKRGYKKVTDTALVIGAPIALAATAHADGGLDMGTATTQLGYGLAAVGALGALKVAPAALSWVWGMVTRNAAR